MRFNDPKIHELKPEIEYPDYYPWWLKPFSVAPAVGDWLRNECGVPVRQDHVEELLRRLYLDACIDVEARKDV